MNPLRVAWEALNEKSPVYLIIVSWCFLGLCVVIEWLLPTAFGYFMTYPVEVEINQWFEISALCLYVMDKLAMLLMLYCIGSSYTEIASWRKPRDEDVV